LLVVDSNVLLYAVNPDSVQHREANAWLDDALSGAETVGFAWMVLVAFLRLSTHPAVFRDPFTVDEATAQVDEWLTAPGAVMLEPTSRHVAVLRGLLGGTGTAGNLVVNAHLAALAVEYGASIVSYDRDFARFPGVKHRLPVAS
jgi:hypothetical protein